MFKKLCGGFFNNQGRQELPILAFGPFARIFSRHFLENRLLAIHQKKINDFFMIFLYVRASRVTTPILFGVASALRASATPKSIGSIIQRTPIALL